DNGVNAGHARVYSYASYSTINEVACDNYTSPSGNYNWLTSGTYTDTIQSVIGTDSIITINLTINPLSNSSSDHSICSNTDFTYADGTEHTSITSDETYISTLTGQAANGCDSIVTENITVLTVDVSVTEDGITITANLSGENYQWIDCNDNNSLISGETNPSFTALINGSYAVIINDGTCSDTSACIMVNSVEIHELDDASSIIIYPNPSIGQITVESPNAVQVEIYNLSGVLIKRTNKKELDLSQEAKGIYFVKLITKINIETTKLIIE
ncbi:MAG: T9SS type A sorting domain-containing protein, partial [Chlamydiia bacterium]|nr:T9SS type A sorting domain-containing protein [Chlamydiia bacterium]